MAVLPDVDPVRAENRGHPELDQILLKLDDLSLAALWSITKMPQEALVVIVPVVGMLVIATGGYTDRHGRLKDECWPAIGKLFNDPEVLLKKLHAYPDLVHDPLDHPTLSHYTQAAAQISQKQIQVGYRQIQQTLVERGTSSHAAEAFASLAEWVVCASQLYKS
eukprot:gnl/MRDRNA2_/MRDRNA2_117577_c0_seq1.p1 gnl/MRDRNA2_/MRDRNA2_117577_c0~~gnl/MRDRNA2_/MRDRNA2_117577_c0_seq1.p1  ORF type:complete len:164 (+),score=22.64 gnl/MRDRNA2_/MRDRNA2_117577_c0_seq1:54-545(+)